MDEFIKYKVAKHLAFLLSIVCYNTNSPMLRFINSNDAVVCEFKIPTDDISYFNMNLQCPHSKIPLEVLNMKYPFKHLGRAHLKRLLRDEEQEYFIVKTGSSLQVHNDFLTLQIVSSAKADNIVRGWEADPIIRYSGIQDLFLDKGHLIIKLSVSLGSNPFKHIIEGHNLNEYTLLFHISNKDGSTINSADAASLAELINEQYTAAHRARIAELALESEPNPNVLLSIKPKELEWANLNPDLFIYSVDWRNPHVRSIQSVSNQVCLPLSSDSIHKAIEMLNANIYNYVLCCSNTEIPKCLKIINKGTIQDILEAADGELTPELKISFMNATNMEIKLRNPNISGHFSYESESTSHTTSTSIQPNTSYKCRIVKRGIDFDIYMRSWGEFMIQALYFDAAKQRFILQVSDPHFGELYINNISSYDKRTWDQRNSGQAYISDILQDENLYPNLFGKQLWDQTNLESLVEYLHYRSESAEPEPHVFRLTDWQIESVNEVSLDLSGSNTETLYTFPADLYGADRSPEKWAIHRSIPHCSVSMNQPQ